MTIVLGVDPGSRVTGYGIVRIQKQKVDCLGYGTIQLKQTAMDERLKYLFEQLTQVIEKFLPDEAAIEQVFMHQNPGAALKLGQARGAAIVTLKQHIDRVAEYSAKQIKQAAVGYGAASKVQVQQMVVRLLTLHEIPAEDAADALAVALCHAYTRQSLKKLTGVVGVKEGRWR